MKNIKDKKFLLVGPLPPPLGGDTRHFLMMKNLIEKEYKSEPIVLNTSRKYKPNNRIINFFYINKIIYKIFIYRNRFNQTIFMASDRGILFSIIPLVCICFLLKKDLYIRICGGSFSNTMEELNYFPRKIINFIFDKFVQKIFVQTKDVYSYFLKYVRKTKVYRIGSYPINSLKLNEVYTNKKTKKLIFLYAGHLNIDKGVGLLLDVFGNLKNIEVECHFAGRESEITRNDINKVARCKYIGVYDYREMVNLISKYKYLILPTWHVGEGEPGVIIESLEACTPVIASKYGGIMDLVDEQIGFLIKPKSFNDLKKCIIEAHKNEILHDSFVDELISRKTKINSYKEFWENKLISALNY